MLCKNCKKEIKNDVEFCKYCGQKVEKEAEYLFCTSCGKQIKSKTLFCKHCGAPTENKTIISEKDDNHNKKYFPKKAIMIVLLIVIVFSALPHNKAKVRKQTDENSYNDISKSYTGGINTIKKAAGNNDCFVCGGDGQKDCTSCDGGYYVEYESGSYLGYGSTTREIRKRCTVCQGSGEVKCYH